MTGAASSLEVVEVVVISWNDMIYIGCSNSTTHVLELTSISISVQHGPSKGRPIWW